MFYQGILVPFVSAFLVSILSIVPLRFAASRYGILDHPTTSLKTHGRSVPYLGGVVVFLGVAAAGLFYPGRMPPELSGLLTGTLVLLIVGLADDLRPISPYAKLFFQILCTALIIRSGLHVSIHVLPPAVNYALTFLWMISIANAFNIIDVHDGLCTGTAAFIAVGLLLVSLFTPFYDKTFVTVAAAALCGGLVAFFTVNHPPAKMFLGDAGSLPIGFLLAGLAIGESYTVDHLVGLLVPFILFLIPIYDLIFVVAMRLVKGLSPIRGSPDHVAIRLRSLGWSDTRVLWSLLAISAAAALIAPGVVFFPFRYALFLAGCAALAGIGIGVALARIRVK